MWLFKSSIDKEVFATKYKDRQTIIFIKSIKYINYDHVLSFCVD